MENLLKFDINNLINGEIINDTHYYVTRIFYEDTDAGGIVYHANYLKYFERARTSLLNLINIDQKQLLEKNKLNADWAICAFDKEEFSCLKEAIKLGGKIRVGFENSLMLPNGEMAPDNETKIKIIKEELNIN